MFILEDYGIPLCNYKLVPGATATAIPTELLTYTERTLAYTSGGTTEIVAGDWIVGATSAAKAQVISVTLTSGTWAGGDAAGSLRIKNQHGTFQSENIKVAAGTNDATIAANSKVANDGYIYKGMSAKAALITVSGNTALVNLDGGKPDQTALVGVPLPPYSTVNITNPEALKNLKAIDYTSGDATTLNIVLYF